MRSLEMWPPLLASEKKVGLRIPVLPQMLGPICVTMMGQVNRERLSEYLGELQRKEDTNDRYVAALRGETLVRKPYERIQPVPIPTDKDAAAAEQPK
ncbi:hypothetical protein KSP40_PGU006085 [Platanthera guangdongensis]|uniref:Uncharacterized protein n=1 Tax=Platanthera guangdongensis TaxID=2320717 RepID=A0ABR2MUU1_9ASPA